MSKQPTAATTTTSNQFVAAKNASSSARTDTEVMQTPPSKNPSSSTAAAAMSVLIASNDPPLANTPATGQASNTATTTHYYANGSGLGGAGISGATGKDKKKIGHREVKDGIVHYKKVSTDELKKAIQFGMVHFINEQNRANSKYNIDRDLLMQDFQTVETIVFPRAGSASTPAHNFNDFKLKVYAPYGFKYLRKKFNVNEVDFMHALGETDLKEISNPGASGSVFYKTSNDKYILKTVQNKESEFLMTLLAGYALNLLQNLINGKYTLLPTIYGLFCYQKLELASLLSDKTNIRIVIMNNILPSDLPIHEKYDLKGSTYKRKASSQERSKSSPTFKDLDFLEEHPDGIILDERHYDNIISSLKRDCLILESFGIMDYSMLLGIHNLEKEKNNNAIEAYYEAKIVDPPPQTTVEAANSQTSPIILNQNKFSSRNLENVFNISAVPARSAKGERLLLYFGIIDILQNYRLKKRAEHTLKSMITDGRQISVCPPNFYSKRFIEFMTTKVFKKATLKSSPARKRTLTFRVDSNLKKNEEAITPSQTGPSTSARFSQISTATNASQQSEQDREPDSVPPPVPPASAIPSSTSVLDATDRAQQQRQQQPSYQANDYKQSFKNIRAIDSVDSVAAILASETSKPTWQNSNSNNNASSNLASNYGDNKPSSLLNRVDANLSRMRQQNQASSFNSSTLSKFQTIEDTENEFLKIDSYKSDNEVESRRTPITPVVHHYKTLDNKINYIKANLEMPNRTNAPLGSSKRDLDSTSAADANGLSTNGITLKIQTTPSSYYQTYSNKSLNSNNPHDSSVLLSNNENDPNSYSSSPWNQSPSLKHYDSNVPKQNQTGQPKFNGQKSSSHQYITKIHINGPANDKGYTGNGLEQSFLSHQEALGYECRIASPASLQYSLTPIAKLPKKANASVDDKVVEFVPHQLSVERMYKNQAVFQPHRLESSHEGYQIRSHSIREQRARDHTADHFAIPSQTRSRITSSFSVKTNNSSLVTVLDRNTHEHEFNHEGIASELADPVISAPKHAQKQLVKRDFSFYVVDTIVPLSWNGPQPFVPLTTTNDQQHFVEYRVTSEDEYLDQRMVQRFQRI